MEDKHYILLLEKYYTGNIEAVENDKLFQWLLEPANRNRFADVAEQLMLSETAKIEYKSDQWKAVLQHVLLADKNVPQRTNTSLVHRVHFFKTAWFRYAAAILLILGIAAYFFATKQNIEKPIIVQEVDKEPGKDKAILTLSDGREIILDDSNKESISDGSISIEKSNGILTYNTALTSAAEASAKAAFNIMNTPRGGQYQLVLPDGSKVWLNAASSIKYPTIFKDKNRIIELSGEAYFEVKENKKIPFIVKTKKAEILVLGTEFNINSYSDEPEFSTTLINGSVKVSAKSDAKIIKPGQQVQISNSQPDILKINNNVDVNQVVAWQKGIFEFDGATIDVIGRQLSRWYDIEVKVSNNRTKKFSGGITKNTPLKTVLKVLEINGIKNKWEDGIVLLYSN